MLPAKARNRPPSCSRTMRPGFPAATTMSMPFPKPAAPSSQEPTQFGQTDFRPALLKLADAKPEVMLVSITAAALQMAQQYKQLGLKFAIAGTTFLQDPELVADPSSEGIVHTQVRIDAPPELAAEFKAKFGVE